MIPGRIKLFWLVALAMVVAAGAVTFVLVSKSRTEVGDLYRTYADMPGIDATFLHNFPLNDTLTIDVTILQATDSAGWERMKKDFAIADLPPEALPFVDPDAVMFKYAPKRDHSLPMDSVRLNNDYVVTSLGKWEISVFDIQKEEQIEAIMYYKLREQKSNKYKTKQIK